MSLFLMTLFILSGCKRPVTFIAPPASLMADCPETDMPLVVNADLVFKVRALRVDLKDCNADKAGLREWSASMAKTKAPAR